MSIRTREVLSILKGKFEKISPSLGQFHSTLRSSAKAEDVITDYKFKDNDGKDILKFFLLKPGPRTAQTATTGKNGLYDDLRTVIIQCFISITTDNSGAKDAELEDAVDKIVDKLFTINRLTDVSGDNTWSPGQVAVTPIQFAKVSQRSCLLMEITTVVGDRRVPGSLQ